MSVRVAVAPGCTGMGSCVRLAPTVFRIDAASGKAVVLLDDCTAQRDQVMEAARACPFVAVEVDGVQMSEPIDTVQVVASERLTPDIIALRLRRAGFTFAPGQYVFLRLTDAQGEFFRTYSVVSSDKGVVTLAIRLVPNGRAGKVLSAIQPGTEVGLSRAKGLFTLLSPDKPKLFVTGGTGLAPVVPMAKAAAGARKLIVVGARNPGDLFWRQELLAIPNTELVEVVQNPDPTWTGPVGLVTLPLEKLNPTDWPEVYTCGGPGMVEAVRKTLVARGFAPDSVLSDSFVAAGSAVPTGERRAVAPAPAPSYDWPSLLRRLHYIASAPLALVILFYALTGFIANRSTWFESQATGTSARSVPAGVELDREHLAPVLAAMLPDGAELRDFTAGTDPKARFAAANGRAWSVEVAGETRGVRIVERGELPAGTELTSEGVAAALASRFSGHPDLDHASAEDGTVQLEFASVWGTHRIEVDNATRTWTATANAHPLVVSLTDLHRGKHAGAWQKVIIDVTALILALVTLSGAAMALMAAAPARRRQAQILIGSSIIVVIVLLASR
ncbi:MAG TPA: hypothetical protein DCS97_04760 [Planctomycetes bacterium]|nr:hypothetical protein [Planctomycetota bacterium]